MVAPTSFLRMLDGVMLFQSPIFLRLQIVTAWLFFFDGPIVFFHTICYSRPKIDGLMGILRR